MVNIIGNAIIGHIVLTPGIIPPDVHILWDDNVGILWDDSDTIDWDG